MLTIIKNTKFLYDNPNIKNILTKYITYVNYISNINLTFNDTIIGNLLIDKKKSDLIYVITKLDLVFKHDSSLNNELYITLCELFCLDALNPIIIRQNNIYDLIMRYSRAVRNTVQSSSSNVIKNTEDAINAASSTHYDNKYIKLNKNIIKNKYLKYKFKYLNNI